MTWRKTLTYYTLAAVGFIYLLTRLCHSEFYRVIQPDHFIFFHTLLEFFSIIVSFTIALQCMASYPYTKSDKKYFLGIIFIIVGMIDLMHTLTYKGMPLSISGSRATYFWIIARLTEASGVLFYILDLYPRKKTSMLLGSIYVLIALITVMGWDSSLPPLLNADGGVNNLKIGIEYLICSLDLIALIVLEYQNRQRKTDKNQNLIFAIVMLLVSELFFTIYQDVYDFDNLVGHAFKFLGYTFIFRVILIKNLREPFQQIENSLEHFNTIFQFAPVGLAIIRKSDNQFVEINNCLQCYLGLENQDIIGKTPREVFFSEKDWPKIIDYANNANSCTETPQGNLEITIVKDGNPTGIAAISAQNIELDHEECILISVTDITELKKLHVEMTRLDRLNLIGQMAAGIAHEIRNPLTVVRGYLQLMSEKLSNFQQKPTIDFMIQELDRANAIIKEYLTLARTSKTSYQSQSLNKILQNLYPLIEADAINQNKRTAFFPGDVPDIKINSKEIAQLVLNFCRNGLEAMSEGGCLTIQTNLRDNNVVLSIQDEGRGIPVDLLDKLGTPFFTTKENGTGLGLAICYRIAQSHRAKIDVNTSSKGTEFLVSFPVPEQE